VTDPTLEINVPTFHEVYQSHLDDEASATTGTIEP
jgi:hypothetical protein